MKRMLCRLLAGAGLLLGTAALSSCRSVAYVDPAGHGGLTTAGQIDFQDWATVATECINSLLRSNALDRPDGKRPVVAISTITNKTNEHVDTELLTKKIREALTESGKALITTAVAAGGPEDKMTYQARELRQNSEFNQDTVQKKGTLVAPDFSLSGTIIEVVAKSGNQTEHAYAFHLSLTDLKTGLSYWEKEVPLIKRETKARLGW